MKKSNISHQCPWFLVSALVISAIIIFPFFAQKFWSFKNVTDVQEGNIRPLLYTNNFRRLKRFIIFDGGGVVKFVMGAAFPVILPDKKRSLGAFYNFQMQYVPPPRPLYWWSFVNTTTFAARRQRSIDILRQNDNSRSAIYEIIEHIMQRSGQSARDCLLKAICEIARAPLTEDIDEQHDGHEYSIDPDYGQNIYHALINAFFTPYLPNVKRNYWDSRVAGSKGANCDELFANCSGRNDWLKRFTRFIE